jgi:nitrite reductase/ring-hydroxylating ferredoxin subunit
VHEAEEDVCSLDDLKKKGIVTVNASGRTIALIYAQERIFAVDNRCPHMGYPLSKGTVKDGVLTCHWHHARFDLYSGCTFDLFADDVESFRVRTEGGRVFLCGKSTSVQSEERLATVDRRLKLGIDHSIDLVMAKSILREMVLRGSEKGAVRVLELSSATGASKLRGWTSGLTILTCMGNMLPYLDGEWRARALFKGVKHVAEDAFHEAVRPAFEPLISSGENLSFGSLLHWFRLLVEQRDEEACQRILLTAIRNFSREEVAKMLFSSCTDHVFIDGGHVYDFLNKSFELLELTGWHHASEILPSLVRQLCNARRHEEDGAWRHPDDLIGLIHSHESSLSSILTQARSVRPSASDVEKLAWKITEGAPQEVLEAVDSAISDGWELRDVALSLSLSASIRVAKFHKQNEFSDWITVLHTLSYCNAVMKSSYIMDSGETIARGIYHGAMKIFLDRFLNTPPADITSKETHKGISAKPLAMLEESMDSRDNGSVISIVDSCISSGEKNSSVISSLARIVVREDAEFHTFQMVEAASSILGQDLLSPGAQRLVLIAAARYISAHSPTERADQQTFDMALRLERGESLHA